MPNMDNFRYRGDLHQHLMELLELPLRVVDLSQRAQVVLEGLIDREGLPAKHGSLTSG